MIPNEKNAENATFFLVKSVTSIALNNLIGINIFQPKSIKS